GTPPARLRRHGVAPLPASADGPWHGRPGEPSGAHHESRRRPRSRQLAQRTAPREAIGQLVPPVHALLAEAPAQADLAARDQRGKVDQAGLDVAQGDRKLLEASNRRLHLVDDALHPQPQAGLVGDRHVRPPEGFAVGSLSWIAATPATRLRAEALALRAARPEGRPGLRLGTETAFEAAARARALELTGRDVIHLEIGEPDFDTPANIRSAAKRALDEGYTHYPPAPGLPELRRAIAEDAARRKRFNVDPELVVVTPGAKPIMFYAILALADSGDEVIYPDPGFPIYESMTRFVGATAVPL